MREAGGFRMGPFELMDLIGHDVNFAVTKSVWEAYFGDPRFAPSVLQRELVDAGFLGRKSGTRLLRLRERMRASRRLRRSRRARAPERIVVHGDLGPAARSWRAGAPPASRSSDGRRVPALPAGASASAGAWLALTDGRTATARAAAAGARCSCVFDLALDYASCTRARRRARGQLRRRRRTRRRVGALQAAGIAVSRFDDVAGLAVMRTVAMLANEAADAVTQGVATPADLDLAMQKGVNYPRGPLAWADAIGLPRVRDVLGNLGVALRRGPLSHRAADHPPRRRRRAAVEARAMNDALPPPDPQAAQALAERVAAVMFARDRASQALGMRIVRVGAG